MKQKNLYLASGYLNFESVVDDECPFAFVIGGRGTGKTFGALDYCKRHYDATGRPFIYMRRTKTQAELVATDIFNPFRPLNDAFGWMVEPFPISKGVYGFYETMVDENGMKKPVGDYIGIIAALTTFSNFRGFDGSNIDIIVYDEFIKNKGEKSIRDEGFSLLNVFETVNRNREFYGSDSVKLVCLSNSNAIGNDVFLDLQLVAHAEFMQKKGKNQYYDFGRGIAIYDLADSEISKRKKDTALYKMDAGGAFSEMSIGNKYEDYDKGFVHSEPLQEYKPLVKIGEICIYTHKSEPRYYCTFHESGTVEVFKTTAVEKTKFIRKFSFLWDAYLSEQMVFDSFLCKKIFEEIFVRS